MTVTTHTGALAELEARAGASDTDRELWLAERRQGVTATELRDIMLAGNRDQAIKDLVVKKREGDSFTGNAYTEWGKEREPVIAAWLAGFGVIPESRVFHAAGNSRHLASPDGIGEDWDGRVVLDEIKTSGKPLPKGGEEIARKGYEWQMQWCNHVLDAAGTWLTVELRHGTPRDGFTAGERTREYYPRDDAIIAQLVEVADLVLAAMDADPVEPVIDEVVDTHAVNYLRAIDEEKRWGDLKREHYAAVVAAGISQESPLARVTYTPAKEGEVVDVEEIDYDAARESAPGLFEALHVAQRAWDEHLRAFISTKPVQGKGRAASARITQGKAFKA